MPNNCYYQMKVVTKDPDIFNRLEKIMKYEDPEYYIYRVLDCFTDDKYGKEDGYYTCTFYGDVAWSASSWVNDEPYDNEDGKRYTTLVELSKLLGFSCEIFTEECGCGFNEHYQIQHGKLVVDDCIDWSDHYYESLGEYNDVDPIEALEDDIKTYMDLGIINDVDARDIREHVIPTLEKYSGISVRYGGYVWDFGTAKMIAEGYCTSKKNDYEIGE